MALRALKRKARVLFWAVLLACLIAASAFAEPLEPELVSAEKLNLVLMIAGLALFVCSLAILDYLIRVDAPEDEGRVTPRREWE